MRLGIFGGSFDPIHLGHLLLAEYCLELCHLDRIIFIPAESAPHKLDSPPTPGKKRLEMLHLAVDDNQSFEVDPSELQREGPSYSVDTLADFHERRPSDDLFFPMGADMFNYLPKWHQVERVCELTIPIVACRPDTPKPDFDNLIGIVSPARIETFKRYQIEIPQIGISSTEIRRRIAADQSIRYQTPQAVEEYIKDHKLYT